MPDICTEKSPSLLRSTLLQLRIVLLITVSFSTLLTLVFKQDFGRTLLYVFFISVCCSALIQGLSAAATYWLNSRRAQGTPALAWPGWPLFMVCLTVGTLLGYTLGTEIGNALTGNSALGIHNTSLRRGLSTLLIALLPGLAVTLHFVGRSRIEAANLRAQAAQRLAAENKLRLLESQLEPHMLFNTLANLRVLIGLDPPRAQAMLDQLIAFLRATLNASRAGNHPLREEFSRLNDYLGLMQIRMGARLRPVLDLPAELAELSIAPLLLQPLVENAIKHGLEPAIDGGELCVTARRVGPHLQLTVSDSGVGLSQAGSAEAQAGSGFGLHQVRERLATQYGPAASLSIAPAPGGGTCVTVQIPIETP